MEFWFAMGSSVCLAALVFYGYTVMRREATVLAEKKQKALGILARGGPKTLEEALFFTPDACQNCGCTRFSVVENHGYTQLDSHAWQGDSCTVTWSWVCMSVLSKYCLSCNFLKGRDWIKGHYHEDDEVLVELRRLQHFEPWHSDMDFLQEYGAVQGVDLKREFSKAIEQINSPYISKDEHDHFQDLSFPQSTQKAAES